MYNRYIPQPDGSYRKNRIEDPKSARPKQHPPKQEQPCQPPPATPTPPPPPCKNGSDAGDFLRRLLPKNMDTGDLLVIILLLLMAGDNSEDKNNALLTLALYLIM